MSLGSRIELGSTLVGNFGSVPAARQCVLDLRCAGFGEDAVGYATRQGGAVVTVLAGERLADARRVLRRDGGEEAAARPGSAIRDAVERALRLR